MADFVNVWNGKLPTNLGSVVDAVVTWPDPWSFSDSNMAGAGFPTVPATITHDAHPIRQGTTEVLSAIPVRTDIVWAIFADDERLVPEVRFVANGQGQATVEADKRYQDQLDVEKRKALTEGLGSPVKSIGAGMILLAILGLLFWTGAGKGALSK